MSTPSGSRIARQVLSVLMRTYDDQCAELTAAERRYIEEGMRDFFDSRKTDDDDGDEG